MTVTSIICSSKFYKGSSKEQQKILLSALNSSINAPLKQQLEDYLTDDSIKEVNEGYKKAVEKKKAKQPKETLLNPEELEKQQGKEKRAEEMPAGEHEGGMPSMDRPPMPSHSAPAGSMPHMDAEPAEPEESGIDTETPVEEPVSESGVEESRKVQGATISTIKQPVTDMTAIKELLNLNGDTNGVVRVSMKKDKEPVEVWIYYEDSINLNNIMTNVIETLNAADYSHLEFNRLARSDNAIVFQMNMFDSESVVKPMEDAGVEE